MGLENLIESFGGGAANSNHAQIVGALVQELESRPSGIAGLVQSLNQNGMWQTAEHWSKGETQPTNPATVENGLAGSGLIESIVQRTGLSQETIKAALAVALPIIVHHIVSNGHVTPQGEPTGTPVHPEGLLQSVLGRIL